MFYKFQALKFIKQSLDFKLDNRTLGNFKFKTIGNFQHKSHFKKRKGESTIFNIDKLLAGEQLAGEYC